MKIVAVDEQSRADYVASVYQLMTETLGDEAKAREVMAKAELTGELPQSLPQYFRDEIVLRRSRKMAEKVAQKLGSGECHSGVFIAGALHVNRDIPGGASVYRYGGETALDIFRDMGVEAQLVSVQ